MNDTGKAEGVDQRGGVPAEAEANRSDGRIKLTARAIPHSEAVEIASRLINSAFNNRDNRARFSIPARIDYDDDLLMIAYLEQQEAIAAAPKAPTTPDLAVKELVGAAKAVMAAHDEVMAWTNLGYPARTLVQEPDRAKAKRAFADLSRALAALPPASPPKETP